jgi:hypothetical protein
LAVFCIQNPAILGQIFCQIFFHIKIITSIPGLKSGFHVKGFFNQQMEQLAALDASLAFALLSAPISGPSFNAPFVASVMSGPSSVVAFTSPETWTPPLLGLI